MFFPDTLRELIRQVPELGEHIKQTCDLSREPQWEVPDHLLPKSAKEVITHWHKNVDTSRAISYGFNVTSFYISFSWKQRMKSHIYTVMLSDIETNSLDYHLMMIQGDCLVEPANWEKLEKEFEWSEIQAYWKNLLGVDVPSMKAYFRL